MFLSAASKAPTSVCMSAHCWLPLTVSLFSPSCIRKPESLISWPLQLGGDMEDLLFSTLLATWPNLQSRGPYKQQHITTLFENNIAKTNKKNPSQGKSSLCIMGKWSKKSLVEKQISVKVYFVKTRTVTSKKKKVGKASDNQGSEILQ